MRTTEEKETVPEKMLVKTDFSETNATDLSERSTEML